MNRKKTRGLVIGALIAALYAALTYISAALGLAYGPVQFRLSEALTVLPLFTPYATAGLTVGCIISNIGSPLGPVDMVFGTAATLISSLGMRALKKKFPYPVLFLFPVLANAVIVGAELKIFSGDVGFFAALASIALGEAVTVYALGIPLYHFLKKKNIFK